MPAYFFHVAIDLNSSSQVTRETRSKADIFLPLQNTSGVHKGPRAELDLVSYKSTTTSEPSSHDWRKGTISVSSLDMVSTVGTESNPKSSGARLENALGHDQNGLATKARFESSDAHNEELGWGIVRLYRDSDETPGLYDDIAPSKGAKGHKTSRRSDGQTESTSFKDEECTTLCILAVPSYLTPSDFLGFVGEKTREDVSHFRMIRTERINRYMVLMKFRNGKRARQWQKEWDGKAFNDMESENCHVVFIKSIIFRAQEASSDSEVSFPDMSNDPFTPSKPTMNASKPHGTAGISSALTTKPMAPPTRSLVELPTCPVCLERMDESIGLLTIPCQHVFHCTCLQKWRGSGCPVCRYTQDDLSKRVHSTEEDVGLNECSVCRSDVNLWVCLICGNVGCGRYDAAHAFLHYKQTSHCFSMDLMNQRVWDYASDGYVHRIMQSKSDGKLVELPSAPANYDHNSSYDDSVPREKLDNISMEYTHLLTSQLESQRLYYEEKLERAADKASKASKDAAAAAEAAERAVASLSSLQLAVDDATRNVIPSLEKERDKANRRAERFEGMARKLEKEWREEKAMSSSLMERVEGLGKEVKDLKVSNEDLAEQNRDMTFFISGQEKLKGLGEEVEQGTVSLPEEPKSKRKGKGKKVGGGSSGS